MEVFGLWGFRGMRFWGLVGSCLGAQGFGRLRFGLRGFRCDNVKTVYLVRFQACSGP